MGFFCLFVYVRQIRDEERKSGIRRIYPEKNIYISKRMKNTEQRLRYISDTYRIYNIHLRTFINRVVAIFEELITRAFLKLMKDINL